MNKRCFARLMVLVCVILCMIPMNTYAASNPKLNKTYATSYIGKTIQLKVSGSKKKVTWKSGNTSIATVNSKGLVKAKRGGSTTIMAKVDGKTLKCTVVFKNPSLNKTGLSLNKGETFTLKLTGATVKKWSSSNSNIASISKSGVVTAKSAGKATITCENSSGVKRTCNVTVVDKKSSMDAEFKATLEKDMKTYGIKYLVDAQPITSGIVPAESYADAKACYGMPETRDFVTLHSDIINPNWNSNAYVYAWIEEVTEKENNTLFKGQRPYDYKVFVTYTAGPTSLSFNHTTFQVGETSGIMRVVNIVPKSKYEWSSSDESVISLSKDVAVTNYKGEYLVDPTAVHIHANGVGKATITCKVTYPMGETKVCTSEIYVSDTIKDTYMTYQQVDMDKVMREKEPEFENYNDYKKELVDFNWGLGSGFCGYIHYITWDLMDLQYSRHPETGYLNELVKQGMWVYSTFWNDYQGYTKDGIQIMSYTNGSYNLTDKYTNYYSK